MFDRYALEAFRPLIERAAREVRERGFTADQVTLTGFGLGLFSAACIALGFYVFAILPLLARRACDAVAGAAARADDRPGQQPGLLINRG